jgi:hypothetical protein
LVIPGHRQTFEAKAGTPIVWWCKLHRRFDDLDLGATRIPPASRKLRAISMKLNPRHSRAASLRWNLPSESYAQTGPSTGLIFSKTILGHHGK